jgi:hypothetical protein
MNELDRRRRSDRLTGGFLVVVGALMAMLCGTCTLQAQGTYGLLALILGGVPTLGGLVTAWLGVRLYRKGRDDDGKRR